MKDKVLEKLFDELAWEDIKSHMEKVDWEWAGCGVPTINKMMTTVEKMYDDLNADSNNQFIATGGFILAKFDDFYMLNFSISDAYAEKI